MKEEFDKELMILTTLCFSQCGLLVGKMNMYMNLSHNADFDILVENAQKVVYFKNKEK